MKKAIVTAVAVAGIAAGAMAQGSIAGINTGNQYITTGVGNYNINVAASTSYYSGGLTLTVLFSAAATAAQADAINALNGTVGGGLAAWNLMQADGFQTVSLTGDYSSAAGALSGSAVGPNTSQINGFPGTVNLLSSIASGTVGYIALYITGTGAYSQYSTAEVLFGNYGGNSAALGQPFFVTDGMNALYNAAGQNQNIDLTAPVPEPGTLALAALGGASLLMFRRKK